MNIHTFNFQELFQNSKGKSSMSLVMAPLLIITGCTMGINGAFTLHGESMLQGLAFAGLGSTLLGLRRFTKDKEISPEAEAVNPKTE